MTSTLYSKCKDKNWDTATENIISWFCIFLSPLIHSHMTPHLTSTISIVPPSRGDINSHCLCDQSVSIVSILAIDRFIPLLVLWDFLIDIYSNEKRHSKFLIILERLFLLSHLCSPPHYLQLSVAQHLEWGCQFAAWQPVNYILQGWEHHNPHCERKCVQGVNFWFAEKVTI